MPVEDPRHPYYELTEKGLEVWPILSSLFQFGIRHHADRVFTDGRPRTLEDVYPRDAKLLLGTLAAYARTIETGRIAAGGGRRASPGAGLSG